MVAKKKAALDVAARSANTERGEHELVLAGAKYLLRPSYAAQVAIEQKTGVSYGDLAFAGQSGAMRIEQAQVIASEMINAGAGDNALSRVSAERVGQLIYEEGLPQIAARLTLALIDALTGGRTASGEAKPVVAKAS
jgi:hypothetical protein